MRQFVAGVGVGVSCFQDLQDDFTVREDYPHVLFSPEVSAKMSCQKPQNEQIPHATCNGLRMHRSDVHFASDKVHLSEHTAVSQQIHNPKEVSETRPIFVKQQSF